MAKNMEIAAVSAERDRYAEEVRARSFPAPEHVFSQEEPGK